MSAPHSDDRDDRAADPATDHGAGPGRADGTARDGRGPARPEERRNGHTAAAVIDGAALVEGAAVPLPRPVPPSTTGPPRPQHAGAGPGFPGPGAGPPAMAPTGPVHGMPPGPRTPPMPWPAVGQPDAGPAPVPSVYPGGRPPEQHEGPAWRRTIAGIGTAGVTGLAESVREAVPHRAAAVAVGATFALAVGILVAAYAGTPGPEPEEGTLQSAAVETPAPVPADLVEGTSAADPAAFGAVPTFSSPTGNIACRMDEGGARCDVENRTWTPPDANCADPGLAIGGPAGPRSSCDGGAPDPERGAILEYGTHVTHGAVTCVSRRSGVECRDGGTGHGFAVARASYRMY
ncbi:hypothetical protein WIS52_18925 [Pseudonocardia nematodicida]|uniref:Uncharacterized protein n=1 Tax=Pseudonocardia nematodicida TaxID=1206997 RepID=A0ABV1KDL2_9PSEU